MKKFFRIFGAVLVIGIASFIYVRYFYVFADGTKAGVLNTFQKKGYIFKTYEGHLILSGFKTNIQSYEFDFSVTNERVAQQLLNSTGKEVLLHYKNYFGVLPWRGMHTYIVDSIYEIQNIEHMEGVIPQQHPVPDQRDLL